MTQDTKKEKKKMANILAFIRIVTQLDYLFSENSNTFVPWRLSEKCC